MKIGIIGGSGKEGRGLGARWGKAGHGVMLGSRDEARAKEAAAELSASGISIAGGSNADAAAFGDVVMLSVPYAAHASTLASLKGVLAGKVLIDITVPLAPPKVRQVNLPPGGAAALEAQRELPDVRVVAALHHVSSVHLADTHAIDCDVLVCSNDDAALALVLGLVGDLGLRGLDAGPLQNAIALESLTPVLLHLNKKYGKPGIGVRFTGLP